VGIHTEATQAFALFFHLVPEGGEEKSIEGIADEVHRIKDHVSTAFWDEELFCWKCFRSMGMSDLACIRQGKRISPRGGTC